MISIEISGQKWAVCVTRLRLCERHRIDFQGRVIHLSHRIPRRGRRPELLRILQQLAGVTTPLEHVTFRQMFGPHLAAQAVTIESLPIPRRTP